jgi:hypothetical protein
MLCISIYSHMSYNTCTYGEPEYNTKPMSNCATDTALLIPVASLDNRDRSEIAGLKKEKDFI